MDKKLIVAAGGVLGAVAIAYLLSQKGGANTGGVISGGMWGFPTSGSAPADPAPPVNIDFPGVTVPPMPTPEINYPEVTPMRYDYYYHDSGSGSTKKQTVYAATVDSSNPSSPFNIASKSTASVASGGGKKSGTSSSSTSSAVASAVKGAATVASVASPVGAAVAVGSAVGKKVASAAAPSIASAAGSVASSIGSALSSIGKAFGW